MKGTNPEAEFLDKIRTKVLRVFLLCLEISSNSRNLLQFLLRRKEENLIENHTRFPLVKPLA
jgi:hypothetical protein